MALQRIGRRGTGQRLGMGIAVALALAPMCAFALGLGAIEVKSRLGQPFVADIPVTLNDPSETNSLSVRLASPEAFARVGLDRSVQVGANLTFTLTRNANGETVIRVTTPQKLDDPFVSFLLEADWGKGKMVREYTALLDPPRMAAIPHRPIRAPQVASTPMPAPPPAAVAPMRPPALPTVANPPAPMPAPVASAPARQPSPPPSEPIPSINAASAAIQPAPMPAPAQPSPPPVPVQPQTPVPSPPPIVAVAPPPPVPASQPVAPPPESIPPPVAPPPPPPIASVPVPAPAPPAAPAAEPTPPVEAAAAQQEPAAPTSETATAASPDAVTVHSGDTLSQIAQTIKPNDVSINRMMIVLQRSNPDAFIHDNINLLRSGAVLRIPGAETTQTLTAVEADTLVQEQVESWRQGFAPAPTLQPEVGAETAAAKPARSRGSAGPAAAAGTNENAAASEPSAANENAPAPASAPAVASHRKPRVARLEIVPPAGNNARASQSGASEGGSGSELRAQLTQAKEDLAARNSEIGDLKSRVADLEKIQKDSQQLITMKDSQLAALQEKLAELQKQQKAPASSANAGAASVAPAASSTVATATPAMAASHPQAGPAAASAKPTPVAPAAAEDATPWYLQSWAMIALASFVLAGMLAMMLRRPKLAATNGTSRKYALADSLAALNANTGKDTAEDQDEQAMPKPAVTGRTTVSEPLPPAPPPASKPYWTGAETVAPAAAESPAPTPAADVAPEASQADADWDIDEAPASVPAAHVITKRHAAMPDLDDPNQTVATKLELARAYIDIGDHDGARGMLEEVLIEGNATQQEEAFKLLDTLDQ